MLVDVEVTVSPDDPLVVLVYDAPEDVVVASDYTAPPAPLPDVYAHRLVLPAAVNLSGHRAVISAAGLAEYADKDTPAHDGKLAGLTLGAALAGDDAVIQVQGLISEPSWNWTAGPVYLGNAGVLTQTRPTSGLLWKLATALNATTLVFEPEPPIHLA